MIPTRSITLVLKPFGRIRAWLTHASFWITLVGAIGLSRTWFGGAWIIDLLAAALAFAVLIVSIGRSVGTQVVMTFDEFDRWRADGEPPNVVEWRKGIEQ